MELLENKYKTAENGPIVITTYTWYYTKVTLDNRLLIAVAVEKNSDVDIQWKNWAK